jgi:hypothetical protein
MATFDLGEPHVRTAGACAKRVPSNPRRARRRSDTAAR